MKTLISFIAGMFITGTFFGQSIDPSVIASGGNYVENGNMTVSYTIGQTVTATMENGNIITQGFQQDSYTIVEIPEQSSQDFSVTIYPVPATNKITIEFNSSFKDQAQMSIIDELGRFITEKTLTNQINTIDISNLSESYYFLKINYQGNFKTYKIQKITHH